MEETSRIHVCLLDEGTDCWRPVEATPLGDNRFKIISENNDPEDEQWQFATGDIVRCEEQVKAEGARPVRCLVAVERVAEGTSEQ